MLGRVQGTALAPLPEVKPQTQNDWLTQKQPLLLGPAQGTPALSKLLEMGPSSSQLIIGYPIVKE